jgi:hypothetical protein
MRKLSFVALLFAVVMFTGCVRPYDKPEYVEIGPNETAFVIPMFTDENVKTEDQVHLNDVEFYQKNMVSSKLIQIPHKWIKTGRFARSGYYKGTVRVITVDLTPHSGNWLQTDSNAIKVETAASQGITIPMSYTIRIKPEDAALYLSFYKAVDFQSVIDVQINRYFAQEAGKAFHAVEYKDVSKQRDIILQEAVEKTKAHFATQGITIDQLAIVDGLIYEDESLQTNIDEQAKIQAQIVLEESKKTLIEKQKANKIAEANIDADVARAKASTLDIELKRARAMQEIENTKIIAQAQAEAIKQGKYAPVPNTVVVQDLEALGSVRDLMQPNE